jgi:hypothetical protein
MPKIAIISTIKYKQTPLKVAFENGLANAATFDIEDQVGFTPNSLESAVLKYDNLATYNLIVTVGGLAAAIAALSVLNSAGDVPFISLVGGRVCSQFPGTITGRFYGGINLLTFDYNNERSRHLTGEDGTGVHNFPAAQICLLVNQNSGCYTEETRNWPIPPRGKIISVTDKTSMINAFADANLAGLSAMIISADPLFQDNMSPLIDAANGSTLQHVCYPLLDYANAANAGHKPKAGHHTLHGPNLTDAYKRLGTKAAWIIANNKHSSFDAIPNEVHDP